MARGPFQLLVIDDCRFGLCLLRSAKLIPEDDQIFTDVELNLLEKVINETTVSTARIKGCELFCHCLHMPRSLLQTWKNETVAEQEKRSPQERPVLLSKDIESKLALLDREVNYLLNKAKFAKPKAKAKAKNSTSSDKSNGTSEEKTIPPTEEEPPAKSGGRTAGGRKPAPPGSD